MERGGVRDLVRFSDQPFGAHGGMAPCQWGDHSRHCGASQRRASGRVLWNGGGSIVNSCNGVGAGRRDGAGSPGCLCWSGLFSMPRAGGAAVHGRAGDVTSRTVGLRPMRAAVGAGRSGCQRWISPGHPDGVCCRAVRHPADGAGYKHPCDVALVHGAILRARADLHHRRPHLTLPHPPCGAFVSPRCAIVRVLAGCSTHR
mmetsp:Transcript_34477/g.104007  ORF Transcript_34477/g.104007 Transcript_34477/m.104007 type:complete len:201 (-) Transcript_34477:86-688(-)